MTHHQINFLGWILCAVTAIGVCIASTASFAAIWGAVVCLLAYALACGVFVIPLPRHAP